MLHFTPSTMHWSVILLGLARVESSHCEVTVSLGQWGAWHTKWLCARGQAPVGTSRATRSESWCVRSGVRSRGVCGRRWRTCWRRWDKGGRPLQRRLPPSPLRRREPDSWTRSWRRPSWRCTDSTASSIRRLTKRNEWSANGGCCRNGNLLLWRVGFYCRIRKSWWTSSMCVRQTVHKIHLLTVIYKIIEKYLNTFHVIIIQKRDTSVCKWFVSASNFDVYAGDCNLPWWLVVLCDRLREELEELREEGTKERRDEAINTRKFLALTLPPKHSEGKRMLPIPINCIG